MLYLGRPDLNLSMKCWLLILLVTTRPPLLELEEVKQYLFYYENILEMSNTIAIVDLSSNFSNFANLVKSSPHIDSGSGYNVSVKDNVHTACDEHLNSIFA